MNKKIFLVIMIFSITSIGTLAQTPVSDPMTIDRAIRLIIENHPAIKQAEQYVVSSRALVDRSHSPYYPEISAVGSYARIGPVISLNIPDQGKFDLYPSNNYDLHLAMRQTIYDFGRRPAGIKLAESGELSAKDNVDLVKSNLVYTSIDLFNSLILLDQSIEVLDEELDALGQHLEVVNKKAEAGTATDFDVLTTQVKVSEVQNQKIDMVNAREKQMAAFHELTGIPDTEKIELAGNFDIPGSEIDYDSLFSLATANLPEFKLARDFESGARIKYDLTSLGNSPTLNMNLEFGFKNGYIPDLNEPKANWIAGVMLTLPVFDGFTKRHKKASAYAELQASQEGVTQIENQISTAIKQAVSDLHASEAKVQTSAIQVEQAQTAYSIAQSRYAVGVITNLDLLDAQLSLARAKLIQQKALYNVVSSRYALNRTVGRKYW